MVLAASGVVAYLAIFYFIQDEAVIGLGYKHFVAAFGLPAAAAAALLVVLLTRAISGEMSVEFFGLKFKGAAGESIIWILCFLAIVYAVTQTWQLEYKPSDPPIRPHFSD